MDRFEQKTQDQFNAAYAVLQRLAPLLEQPASPGDRMMLLSELEEATRQAYVAAGTMKNYQSRAAARAAGRMLHQP